MKKTLTWLCTIGLIACVHFYPKLEPVIMAAAWIIIVLACVLGVLGGILYVVDSSEKTQESIEKVANRPKPGVFAYMRVATIVLGLAYIGLTVTAVFWFFAMLCAMLPGAIARGLSKNK